ncbi:hypothetical protein [Pseudodonghicola flavimaris]|uniref:Uncharacterized protein n=1 Tax=Pseudodonghicola flavimaris TaxID=3050036 RepID=A0ABT7F6W2_9RHOB|nr:hypothetical protein [Pseudodonghicola flavimaris]MDK3020347.1 hypothetical protein [Pseudodonghicola flavimaris]
MTRAMLAAVAAMAGTIAALSLGAPAAAFDVGETQRCIWRCLSGSPGAASREYNQCVARNCSGEEAPGTAAIPVLRGGWRSGLAADGITYYAGATLSDSDPTGVYFMCAPGQAGYLMLYGSGAAAGIFSFGIGRARYPMPFDRRRQELTVTLMPGAAVLQAMAQGSWLVVRDGAGQPMLAGSLAGAGQALRQAQALCYR